jgi:hypothetical protein
MYDPKTQLDHEGIREDIRNSMSYWERQPTDDPFTLNGFNGTWSFEDHASVPQSLQDFVLESFHPEEKFRRIPVESINELMNRVWEGPGSMPKIMGLLHEMRVERNTVKEES